MVMGVFLFWMWSPLWTSFLVTLVGLWLASREDSRYDERQNLRIATKEFWYETPNNLRTLGYGVRRG